MAQLSSTTVFGELSVTAKSLLQGNVGIGTTSPAYALDVSGDIRATGTFRGSLTGNASTATTLATARTINGTSFNGSANITTANWGTARTLTIGSTGKSVNGSGNVSWTLAEIGAAPASHTHSYLPLSGGNLTGRVTTRISSGGASIVDGSSNSALRIETTSTSVGSRFGISWSAGKDHSYTIAAIEPYVNSGWPTDLCFLLSSSGSNIVERMRLYANGDLSFSGTLTGGTVPWARISGAPATATSHPTWAQVTGKPSTFTPSSHSHGAGDLPSATTSAKGVVQLSSAVNSTSTTLAATASAVKSAYDLANSKWAYNEATIKAVKVNSAGTADTLATARTINGTSFNGSANITTANWGTARTLTIGDTGKSVNGSANVSWSLSEIGVAPVDGYTTTITITGDANTYYPVRIGGISRKTFPTTISIWKNLGTTTNSTYPGNHSTGTSSLWLQYEGRSMIWDGNGGYYKTLYKSEPYATLVSHTEQPGSSSGDLIVYLRGGTTEYKVTTNNPSATVTVYYSSTSLGSNATVEPRTSIGNGGIYTPVTTAYGNLSGNASTATTLATARTINGTSFNGSANITTANWGTARTLTIGSTGKSVNGSGNVSWTLAEIGAAPASHTHTASQVGLGNVQNYGIATQAQAQAGTANNVYMTPLRVKNAISAITKTEIESKLGLNDLLTTHKSTVVGAINELFTDVGNGKTLIAGAITDKGVPTNPSDTFSAMAGNIMEIGKLIEKDGDLLFTKESPDYGGVIQAITFDDNYIYVGGATDQRVKKLNKSDLSVVATSPDYGGAIYALTTDDNFIYVGGTAGGFGNETVKKLNKSDLSVVATSPIYGGAIYAITSDDNYVYVGGTTGPLGNGRVKKFNKSNLSLVATGPDSGGTINALTSDDNYVYVGGTAAQKIQKLNKSNLSVVATSPDYGGAVRALTIDDNYIYAGGQTSETVRTFNKSDLSLVATSPSYGGTIYALAIDDNYIYVGGQTSQTVKKIDRLKTILPVVVESPNYGGIIYALTIDDNYIYVGGATDQRVKKLNKSVYELDGIDYVRI